VNNLLPLTKLELLAPAKNLECGLAAVDYGADAVYIGAQRFGARAAVGNSIDDIRQLCDYAHRFAVKVYVTINTIVYDDELEDTQRLIGQLQEAGVDAILVQDMAVLQLAMANGQRSTFNGQRSTFNVQRSTFNVQRSMALHASTQTDNRTADKVRWLRDLGFRRVVLARELSADEIAAIHREVPDVELEVFVHGALCVSYSGQCYASQYCFGRSANRGACAQVCRMKFDLLDADGRELEHQRYLLSLKDLNLSGHLEELIRAGATSFKIEGRLKDAAYVKNVVAAYSQQLNDFIARHPETYCRASKGECTYSFVPNLKKTFNRGFTTYFLKGRKPDIFSPDTPKAMGEYVGTVKELRRDSFNVAGTAAFANGDGLCFVNDERELEGFRVNRAEGNRLFPQQMPRHLRRGMALYRNNDMEFERQLGRQSSVRRIAVTMCLEATADGFSLTADGVTVSIPCAHQQAEKPQRENIVSQLSKLGGTAYTCKEVVMAPDFGFFIPSSKLGELRRLLVQELDTRCKTSGNGGTPKASGSIQETNGGTPKGSSSQGSSTPSWYSHAYLYNIANKLSQQFYGAEQASAFELRGGNGPLMQCRHCLRYSLGACVKHGGKKPEWREPLFLRLGDGRRFRLEFDCKNCQMNIYSMHNS
jgi:putative protease